MHQSTGPSEIISNKKAGEIALPFNEDQFKDFIVGLLGKPQTISKRFRGNFEVTKENLISLYTVLHQRVEQQNDSKLIQFRATVYYSDNSTVTLTGFDHLINYNESLPVISEAIHLTWQYLIKFRDKDQFEKQEISVSFITDVDHPIDIDGENNIFYFNNNVNLRIQHTARTWGADIEGLLTRHIETIIKKETYLAKIFRRNSDEIQNAIIAIITGISLISSIVKNHNLRLIEKLNTDIIFWIHHYGELIFVFTTTFFLIKVTTIFLETYEIGNKPSFLLLTTESEKNKIKILNSYNQNWRKYFLTIVFSLILSIAGNWLYTFIV